MLNEISTSKVVNSFVWKMLERIIVQGIGLIIQVVLARLLFPKEFALLALLSVFINYADILIQSGFSTVLVQKKKLDGKDISTATYISFFLSLLLYIFLFTVAPTLEKTYGYPNFAICLRFISLTIFFNSINSIQMGLFQRDLNFKILFFRSLFAVCISGIIGIVLAINGYGIWALVLQKISFSIVMFVFNFIKGQINLKNGFSISRVKSLYSFGSKVMLSSLVSGFFDSLRTMVIGKSYTSDDLAYYDKAYTYSFYVIQIFGYSISSIVLPVLSQSQDDLKEFKIFSRKAIQLSTFFMFPIIFGAIGVANELVLVLLTERWIKMVPFFILFLVLRLPECMISIDKQSIYALGKSNYCLYYEIFLCCANVIVLIITKNYGIYAIAIGSVIVQLIASFIISIMCKKIFFYSIKERVKDVIKPFVNSLIMLLLILLINYDFNSNLVELIIKIVVGIIAYIVLCFLSNDVNFKFCINYCKNFINMRKK